MSAPFCTACGASVAAGTRFCTKCGQPVGQAAPPPPPPTYEPTPEPKPAPPSAPQPTDQPTLHFQPWSAPAAPVSQEPLPPPPPVMMEEEPVKQGSNAGLWIAVFGLVLLIGGAGLWFYTVRMRAANATVVQVASTPVAQPDPPAPPPAPSPAPAPEVAPPNPDLKRKDSASPPAQKPAPFTPEPKSESEGPPIAAPPPVPVPDPGPAPAQPVAATPAPVPALRKPQGPTSGVLHAAVEVAQYGEVVFDNLPNGRLKFTYDHSLWMPTISRQANGTQTLVMRSLKPGVQRVCDVKWEIVQ